MLPVRAALAWPDAKAYLFSGSQYTRYAVATGLVEQSGLSIAGEWLGLRTDRPDASVLYGFGKADCFYGSEYLRYDVRNDAVEPEYLPRNPAPGLSAGRGSGPIGSTRRSTGAPASSISSGMASTSASTSPWTAPTTAIPNRSRWNGIWPDRIDSVLHPAGDKAHLFRDDEYRRFSRRQHRWTRPARWAR